MNLPCPTSELLDRFVRIRIPFGNFIGIFFFGVRLIEDIVLLVAQIDAPQTIGTASEILGKPHIHALITVIGKECPETLE